MFLLNGKFSDPKKCERRGKRSETTDGSTKEGVGTAYHTSSQVWFTIAHGIVNEIYYPHIDRPNTRDLQFLITDGESFVHEERRDLDHAIGYPETNALVYRLINSDRGGRYRIVKEIICDPHHSVLLLHTRVEILDESLSGKLRVFALLAPHLNRAGAHNSAVICGYGGRALFHVFRADAKDDPNSADLHMSFGSQPDFLRRSVGYVGASDGWQDLRDFKMDWEFPGADDGNIALTAECDLSHGDEFTLAVGFARSARGGGTKVLQAFATPFAQHREAFVANWQAVCGGEDHAAFTGDGGSLFRLSRLLLHAHEDKVFCGGIVASLSIPWGETKGDGEIGGYHLVWPRDLMQSCTGLLAMGHTDAPARAGKTLRVITTGPAIIHWSGSDGHVGDATAQETNLGCWYADLPTGELPAGTEIHFHLLCDGETDGAEHTVKVA